MNEDINMTPSQLGSCYRGNYYTPFQQLPTGQNIGQQPLPMQIQQQPAQPFIQQQPMAQVPMIPGPAVREAPVQFTDFEQIANLTAGIPITAESIQYLNGFLRTQIGRRVKVEFLIGTNSFVDKEGILLGVGVNYILINETETDDITACDFYNIKFIKFYY